MLKYTFRAMAVLAVFSVLASCGDKTPKCEKNHTGELTVTNDNPFSLMVDIVAPSTGNLNRIQTLREGESATYTFKAGEIATVQISDAEDVEWLNLVRHTVVDCDESDFIFRVCDWADNQMVKNVKVTNETGVTGYVDVYSYEWNQWYEEVRLRPGESVSFWELPVGEVYIWGEFRGEEVYSDDFYVGQCETLNFSWTDSKVAGAKKMSAPKSPAKGKRGSWKEGIERAVKE